MSIGARERGRKREKEKKNAKESKKAQGKEAESGTEPGKVAEAAEKTEQGNTTGAVEKAEAENAKTENAAETVGKPELEKATETEVGTDGKSGKENMTDAAEKKEQGKATAAETGTDGKSGKENMTGAAEKAEAENAGKAEQENVAETVGKTELEQATAAEVGTDGKSGQETTMPAGQEAKKEKGTEMEQETKSARCARVERKTRETQIVCELNLDGTGTAKVDTGIGFFDHMLISFAKHGFFDLTLTAKGDLFVDCHHTIEDVGIVLGQAIKEALGDKEGIARYGSFLLPMDETLVLCAVDLSGRPYLNFDMTFTTERVGYYDTEMVREFFYAISYSAGMNLHLKQMDGTNNHHLMEAAYKAFAKALDMAVRKEPRLSGTLSTKGTL